MDYGAGRPSAKGTTSGNGRFCGGFARIFFPSGRSFSRTWAISGRGGRTTYTRRVSGRSRAFSLWPFGSWGLHILCDIPTHSLRFFPTPYLWPLPTPFYNGHSWGNRTFMLANYAGIALAYLVLAYRQSKWTES